MSLEQTLDQLTAGVRKFANVQGTTALARHPNDDLYDYVNRALGSLHRKISAAMPEQRMLSTAPITTERDVSLYPLPDDFGFLISVEMTADGRRRWLQGFQMQDRPALLSPDASTNGIPSVYRLEASNIEFLPTPAAEYTPQLWYVPTASQLESGSDTFDTISRLDDYVIAYAARFVAIKDKNWDLAGQCKALIDEITPEIAELGRNRDRNSPAQVIDVYARDRWGRRGRR